MTVKDIVAEPLTKLGISRRDVIGAVKNALELVGLDSSFLTADPQNCQVARDRGFAIARAIITNPRINSP
jgi:ABC-type dipeptide/oligopeptide/nickel transport system, ATPase component